MDHQNICIFIHLRTHSFPKIGMYDTFTHFFFIVYKWKNNLMRSAQKSCFYNTTWKFSKIREEFFCQLSFEQRILILEKKVFFHDSWKNPSGKFTLEPQRLLFASCQCLLKCFPRELSFASNAHFLLLKMMFFRFVPQPEYRCIETDKFRKPKGWY